MITKKRKSEKPTAFVGMSGGVDSSVAAAMLSRRGFKVVGVFIKVQFGEICSWREERRDAMRVAARLKIPLLTLDLSGEYKRAVIKQMLAEYQAGRTPNSDVECNRQIKFGAFYRWAVRHGADFVATGHYARLEAGRLWAAKDKNKDQTYFLWTLSQNQLTRCLFPIGEYTKPEVRRLAKKFGLPNWDKKDSQGLCFVGRLDFKNFLREHLPRRPGRVLNEAGETIGRHDGAWFYTSGERHGFQVTKKTPNGGPLYVVGKDLKKNLLLVGPRESADSRRTVELTTSNWLAGKSPPAGRYRARIRHQGLLLPVRLTLDTECPSVTFAAPPFGLAPGQSLVFYRGEECLGGGIIN